MLPGLTGSEICFTPAVAHQEKDLRLKMSTTKHDIALLDFLRGWSAVLVFFHHAAILGGGPGYLTGALGKEAVNVFMMASGFLIYLQCSTSAGYDHLQSSAGIRNFYVRRFFRIAPAYYVALLFALLLSSYLGQCREQIAQVLPSSATSMERYYIEDYVTSVLVHVSFIFGLFPKFAFSTPLPDWSLGLEMQFYFVFPLLYFGYRKNFKIALPVTLILMYCAWMIIRRSGLDFPMPSLLPLSFHNFAAGIALAYLMLNPDAGRISRMFVIATVLFFLLLGNRSLPIPLLFVFGCWFLSSARHLELLRSWLQRVFAHRSSKILADISYSLYIFHLLLMLPYFSWLLSSGPLPTWGWFFASAGLFAVTAIVAYCSYRYIESPGIRFGKRWLYAPSSSRG